MKMSLTWTGVFAIAETVTSPWLGSP